jgi:TetR/AcrR family transcriptional regulator, mexJK operon transcriptional repressor
MPIRLTSTKIKEKQKTAPARRDARSRGMQARLDDDRVSELLDVATEVFIEHGFHGASTNEIARRANCSKTTFYSRFPTKEKLFTAVLERRTKFIFEQFARTLSPELPLEEALKEYGSSLLQIALSEDQIALFRVISMESPRFPQLGECFYELGPGKGLAHLGAYLAAQVKLGRLMKEDPLLMAEHLRSLLTGGYVRWAVLGVGGHPSPKERRRHIEAAVKVFLRAYSALSKSKRKTS